MEKFAFIIHPMDLKRDAARKYPVLRYLPLRAVESIALKISPKIMSHITGIESPTGAQAEGWLIGCPLSPKQLTELPHELVYDKIADAGRMGAQLGAKIVGLGAFTSVAGDAGISVAKRLEGVINVTSGNSYTVYTGIEGLLRAAELMEIDVPHARAAIIGATGSIGAVCARMLAASVAELALVGRNVEKLEELRAQIESQRMASRQAGYLDQSGLNGLSANRASATGSGVSGAGANGAGGSGAVISVATDIKSALREADLVLAVSSSTDVLIYPEDLKSGAVVCDVARPRDVSKQVIEERDDVLVIEGGVIDVPGDVNFNFNFGFPNKTAYACMSETILMALEGTYEPYTLGRELTMGQVQRIGQIARKHGFKLSGFRSFETAVDEARIAAVRANARRRGHSPAPASVTAAVA